MRALFSLTLALVLASAHAPAADATPFTAPRATICLNGEWEIAPATAEPKIPASGWITARVPAAPVTEKGITARWYRITCDAPAGWASPGRRFYVQLEKVGHYAAVFCNGRRIGEHFGQYTPGEFDITEAFRPGQRNELAIYVHNASGRYARPGADITDEMMGNSFRPATNELAQRNWIGIVGDVTLAWRPATQIADVFVDTSVREKRLTALAEIQRAPSDSAPLQLRTAILDGRTTVLELPAATIPADGKISLTKPWADPVLWGSPPYGEPKLYTLRTELVRDGQVVDRMFTRFGFREVWIAGRDVLLNGRKLWLAGTYHSKLSPLRVLNDRRPFAAMNRTMHASGLNALHGHWDDLGDPWLDVCDETGMFVLAGFFCDGRPQIQSKAEPGWVDWMAGVCAEWVRARRNHPSILLWRPTDVTPEGLARYASPTEFRARLAREVRRLDPSHRPLADDSDIVGWGQSPENRETGELDNFAPLETAARSGKPFLNKEIYGGFNNPPKLFPFFRAFYQKSFDVGSSGMFVQHLPLLLARDPLRIQWLSTSGPGNRDTAVAGLRAELPNWCDPDAPAIPPTQYAREFHDLFPKYLMADPQPRAPAATGEALVTGLAPRSFVFLATDDPAFAEPQGLLAAGDGTAWYTVHQPGAWRLFSAERSQPVEIAVSPANPVPGYGVVPRVSRKP